MPITNKYNPFILNDCMKMTCRRGYMLMGLSQILNAAHVRWQKRSVRVKVVDRFWWNFVDVERIVLFTYNITEKILLLTSKRLKMCQTHVSASVYTMSTLRVKSNFWNFLLLVPLQIFFFLAVYGCLGIIISYFVGILNGIQNQSCVPFWCGVNIT